MSPATQPADVDVAVASRHVIFRTRGRAHGPIVRMVSPSDVGEMIKPFVFLDLVDTQASIGSGFGWHPHSGIATLTLVIDGRGSYAESTGHEGTTVAGDIEWMSAGRGVWHTGTVVPPVKVFQLWVALPPERELAPAFSQHLSIADIPSDGPARVLLGRSGDAVSPIDAPPGLHYVVVQLKAGERWTCRPQPGCSVGWTAVMDGSLRVPDPVGQGELVVFDPSDTPIEFEAVTDVRFVVGTAVPHPHDLHLGNYSVHTSAAALVEGEREIVRIGHELRAKGALR
ncbi:pirin domain-containing protein [Burkholderia lata]|uniref:pirin family protein n=1 Tax=Burkholderia lata (strain ATCC 17760 / DSM 23089 / LMG 22485 / NCIMB 9086 / R18194 / 383) TaxID=482957 RepID=UPI0014537327|nr:pirin family protein [Burkholderia lata]VWC81704.1 pirin domain-containing protein [Burkholderia lata]